MTTLVINPAAIAPAWLAFQRTLPVQMGTIHDEAAYDRAVAFMNSLLDVVGDNEAHELAGLLELVGQLVQDYDDVHHSLPDAAPNEVLRFLMAQHNAKQSDLAADLGGQSAVSDILNAKRPINARQAKALAARYGVSAAVFL
jgi:HTH-type transcriptional regulator / antitoxin HigA